MYLKMELFIIRGNPASGSNGIDISGILSSGDNAFFAFTNYRGSAQVLVM